MKEGGERGGYPVLTSETCKILRFDSKFLNGQKDVIYIINI